MELLLEFYDLMEDDLVEMVENSRKNGIIPCFVNANFITLIPEESKPSSLSEFHLISLCNLLYKLISKIIANPMHRGLSQGLSREQFIFLYNRQILYVEGSSQEVTHSMKVKQNPSMVLKLDIVKNMIVRLVYF